MIITTFIFFLSLTTEGSVNRYSSKKCYKEAQELQELINRVGPNPVLPSLNEIMNRRINALAQCLQEREV
jgi:hypothetical protein